MLRRAAPIAFAFALAGCGATPTSPAPIQLFQLAAGPYTLSVSVSQTIVVNPIGIATSITACSGSGAASILIPVDLTREGDVWVARAQSGNLTLRLAETSGTVHGSMQGRATEKGVTLTVVGESPWESAALSAALSGSGAGGHILGSVSYDTAQTSQSCSSNAWSLSTRR